MTIPGAGFPVGQWGWSNGDAEAGGFEQRYERLEKKPLGEGTYGEVYKARCSRTGEIRALKRMKLDQEDEGVPSTAIREVAILKILDHENVVKLYDTYCSQKKLYLVFEFVESDLKKYLKSRTPNGLSPEEVKSLGMQLCRGVDYLHSNRIIHRDLKPQNLLITSQGSRLKIADYGLARAYSIPMPKYTHEVITVWYRCPEILLGISKYSIAVDFWSVGCIIAEMANSVPLFPGDSEIDTIFRIFRKLGTPDEITWPGLNQLPDFKDSFPKWRPRGLDNIPGLKENLNDNGIDLINLLLIYNPAKRLSCRRALSHQYFQ
jgi:serine/threonine protein kinase